MKLIIDDSQVLKLDLVTETAKYLDRNGFDKESPEYKKIIADCAGEWVGIKSQLTQEDSDYIQQSQISLKNLDVDTKKVDANFDFGEMAILARGILSWSLKTDDGQPLMLTPKNISHLMNPYRRVVLEKINALNDWKRGKPILKN